MTDETQQPHTTAAADSERQARLAREADALRENLRRRKDQVRRRALPAVEGSED